jgi:hypothetical protein
MKRLTLFALIALAVVTGQAHAQGETLELSGQIYTTNIGNNISYSPFNGSMAITVSIWTGISGTGKVEGGKLSMTISAPPSKLNPFTENRFYTPAFLSDPDGTYTMVGSGGGFGPTPFDSVALYNGLNFSAAGVEYASFSSLEADGGEIARENFSGTAVNLINEEVEYIYVNKDVTITGRGKTTALISNYDSSKTLQITTSGISLTLKKGWNAVYTKTSRSFSRSGNISLTIEMSVGDPAQMKWLFYTSRGI